MSSRYLPGNTGKEHQGHDHACCHEIISLGNQVHRQEGNCGKDRPCPENGCGHEDNKWLFRLSLRLSGFLVVHGTTHAPAIPPGRMYFSATTMKIAGKMRKRSPGSPSQKTRTPARTGPIAYPKLPPTTKYEVIRPRFSWMQSRFTRLSAVGWKQACPSAAMMAKSMIR